MHAVEDWHRASPEEKLAMMVRRPRGGYEDDARMHEADEGGSEDPRGDARGIGIAAEPREEPDHLPPEAAAQPIDEASDANKALPRPQTDLADEFMGDPSVEDGAGAPSAADQVQDVLTELERPPEEEGASEIKEEQAGVDLSSYRAHTTTDMDADGEGDQDGDQDGDENENGGGDADADDFKQEANILRMINSAGASGMGGTGGMDVDADVDVDMDVDNPQPTSQTKVRNQRLKALRAPLLDQIDLTDTVINLTNLRLATGDGEESSSMGALLSYDSVRLPDLFPELATFGPFVTRGDSSRGSSGTTTTKPDKRTDETTSMGKITYTSRLMDVKPVLISTLQPGKKRKVGEWDDLGEYYPADDSNAELKPTEYYMPSPPRECPLYAASQTPLS